MRLYTIEERKTDGVDLLEIDSDYYIGTGHEVGQAIPLGKTLRDKIDILMGKMKDCTQLGPVFEDGSPNPWHGKDPSSLRLPKLKAASFSDDGLRLIQEKNRDRAAMVNICTAAGERGKLMWTARSYSQHFYHGRVRQRHDDFVTHDKDCNFWSGTPTAGTEILVMGHGQQDEPHAVVLMHPGSGFRLRRTGDLGDATPELHVLWTGEELLCFTPKRFKKAA
jgi:hypothetical protein